MFRSCEMKKKRSVTLKKTKKWEGIKVKLPREKIFSLIFHSPHFPLIAKQWKTQVFLPIFSIPPKIYPTKHNVNDNEWVEEMDDRESINRFVF